MPEQVKKTLVHLIYFALAVSALLVFWQVRNFDFVNYDDNQYVYENPHVTGGLTQDGIVWAFTTGHAANWHPVTWLSLMLDCQLFGPNPGRMHLVNLLLHIANTLLLFTVLRKMTGTVWPGAFVAAAFALHPMHVESVAWIAERKDVLSTFLFLLTLAAYVGYVRRRGTFRYLLTILLFTLGLLAKPMLVTLPFVLLLLDYWPLGRFDLSQPIKAPGSQTRKSTTSPAKRKVPLPVIIEKIPFFALAAVISVITFIVQKNSGVMLDINELSLQTRVANAFLSYVRYIGKMFWPKNLAVFYPCDIYEIPFWQIILCVLLILVISFLAVRFGRNRKYMMVGWLWFLGTLVPVIGIVQVGGQALADRYTYIPYIGLFIIIAWGMAELLSKWQYRKLVIGISMVITLTALGICTRRETSYWNNSISLFSHAIEVTHNNEVAHNALGNAYDRLGRYQEAIDACQQAIRIRPDYVEAHYNLGVACTSLDRYQEAIEAYKQAVRIKPDYIEAISNLGAVYGKMGRFRDAIETYAQAIRIKPNFVDAYYNLGFIYSELGRYQDAIVTYKQAVRIKPNDADTHYNLGVTYLLAGDKVHALDEYNILKTLNPELANKLFAGIDEK